MTSALGLAATSAVLQQLISDGFVTLKLADVLGASPVVTCLPPEKAQAQADLPSLNLVLYNQTRNTGWANLDLPSRGGRGERSANPALALDLHYLLVAYGLQDFQAEVLLGAAMQVLHDSPALGREAIRRALKPEPSKPTLPKQLEFAGLADQLEQMRITAMNLGMDEVSRLWGAIQLPARPSAAYSVSVLLTQTPRSVRTPLPVSSRQVHVLTLRSPRIDRVEAEGSAGTPILPNSIVRISGALLKSPQLTLKLNGVSLPPASLLSVSDEEVRLQLSPALVLRAGLCSVQVCHAHLMGSPPQPHGVVESNLGALVLHPQAVFALEPGAGQDVIDGQAYAKGRISATVTPPVGARQRVRLLLNEKDLSADRPARAYSFDAPEGNGVVAPATSNGLLRIPFQHVLPGRYLTRLQVDAGVSPLSVAADGRFAGPELLL